MVYTSTKTTFKYSPFKTFFISSISYLSLIRHRLKDDKALVLGFDRYHPLQNIPIKINNKNGHTEQKRGNIRTILIMFPCMYLLHPHENNNILHIRRILYQVFLTYHSIDISCRTNRRYFGSIFINPFRQLIRQQYSDHFVDVLDFVVVQRKKEENFESSNLQVNLVLLTQMITEIAL